MNHWSDDDTSQELEHLGKAFYPKAQQKEKIRQQVFQTKIKRQPTPRPFLPTVVSIIFFMTLLGGTLFFLQDAFDTRMEQTSGHHSEAIDVTHLWKVIALQQTERRIGKSHLAHFTIVFGDGHLEIINNIHQWQDPKMTEENMQLLDQEPLTLIAGKYGPYKVLQEGQFFTVIVEGEDGISFTLEKIAPRKFIGPDQIEFMTSIFIEEGLPIDR